MKPQSFLAPCGVALGGGVGGVRLKNKYGAIMSWQSTTEGQPFKVSVSGVSVF